MYILNELSKDEIMLSGLKALIDQTPNQIAINKEGTTDLVANEKVIAMKGGKTEIHPGNNIFFHFINFFGFLR